MRYCFSTIVRLMPAVFFGLSLLIFSPEVLAKSSTASLSVDFSKNQTAEQQTNLLRTSDGISVFRQGDQAFFLASAQDIPVVNAFPFLTVAPVVEVQNYDPSLVKIQIRFSKDGLTWDPWLEATAFEDGIQAPTLFIGNLFYLDTTFTKFQYMVLFSNSVQSVTPVKVKNLRFDFFSPGQVQPLSPGLIYQRPMPGNEGTACSCPMPGVATRTEWNCPDGQNPSCPSPEFSATTHLIVHHSAGSNTSTNWAATVLSIWNFHVNTNGWCDIGYNYVIDPDGVIYEGRGGGADVKGAHFCANNSGAMGVCMLGSFESSTPTSAALESLRKLLAWKSCDSDLNPLISTFHASTGKNLPVISGHRDGCATACPGDAFYAIFPSLRVSVDTALSACQGVSSLEDEFGLLGFRMYPNPGTEVVRVSWDQQTAVKGSVMLTNVQGSVLYQQNKTLTPGVSEHQIDVRGLASGLYVLHVQAGATTVRKQLIVRH
ncbi:MAG: N-acetylmuramoyl-L-alanine amidase [Bacteroidia bacterium]|nr:N-acetylmuramoyl-L-alanine amidase [Bacteroidia bacterium]